MVGVLSLAASQSQLGMPSRRVDNMEAALLHDEHTDLVSTKRLGIPETGQSASHLPSCLQGWLRLAASLGAAADL